MYLKPRMVHFVGLLSRSQPFLIIRVAFSVLMQAATIASFSRMTIEDSRKLLPADLYPSWVVFSSQQKVFGCL